MNQLLVMDGPGRRGKLYGMLDLPEPGQRKSDIACILLSPGVKPRGGPHQLYRKLSQAFTSSGIPVLRLDFSGIGDSPGEFETSVLNDVYSDIQSGRGIPDVSAAMDDLSRRLGVSRFIVGGLCGAAISGLLAAESDQRVAGVFSIGMPVVLVGNKASGLSSPTEAHLAADREVLRRKLGRLKHWINFFTFKSDYRLLWTVFRRSVGSAISSHLPRWWRRSRVRSGPQIPEFLDRNFIRALFSLTESGRSILLLFGGSDRHLSEYQEYFELPFKSQLSVHAPLIQTRVIPEANHVLGEPLWIDEARKVTADWLQTLAAPPVEAAQPAVVRVDSVEIVSDPAEFAALRTVWNALLERSATDSVTLTWEWLSTWWQVYGEGRRLCVVLVRSGDRLVGAAPLVRRSSLALTDGLIPLRRIELMGSGEDRLDSVCSDYIGWIAEKGAELAVADAVMAALVEGRCGTWDQLLLPDMQVPNPMSSAIVVAGACHNVDFEEIHRDECPIVTLPPSWEEYLKGLGPNHRKGVKRTAREFATAGGTYKVAGDITELEQMREDLIRLHQGRWIARGEPGAFASRKRSRFHELFMPLALERGWLRLGVMSIGGEALGAIYNLTYSGRVFSYQTGITPPQSNAMSPGVLLHASEIQAAIQSGQREYDFLKRGLSKYKDRWCTGNHVLATYSFSRRNWLARSERFMRHLRARASSVKRRIIRARSAS